MKIYNTLTRKKDEFVPIRAGYVGLYACGPTVYGPPHLGHARPYINVDTLRRFLEFQGFKVKYVQNITDVGHLTGDSDEGQDKILKQSIKENIDPFEVAYRYEVMYFNAMDALNVRRPSISSRATGFIIEMIEMIKTMIDKGYAYSTANGNVYFRVHMYSKYGQLSNRTLDNNMSGERIDVASDKENSEDFALWKKAEPEHIMKWQSPWGIGFPGWHIECSTMSKKFLGNTFDIHCGGMDNIFPHHECECAQSEVANGVPIANYFVHNNLLTINGTKMGKSLGNFITLPELFEKYNPMTIRYFIEQFQYRSPIDFNEEGLKLAEKQYEKLNEFVQAVRSKTSSTSIVKDKELKEIWDNIISALSEDMNTPVAFAELLKLVKVAGKNISTAGSDYLSQLNELITVTIERILGFTFSKVAKPVETQTVIPVKIIKYADERVEAKKNKDFALADQIRSKIEKEGYSLKDTRNGYEIEKI